jgi:hypothetical protein
MATIQQEIVKLNKVNLGSNLVIFYFLSCKIGMNRICSRSYLTCFSSNVLFIAVMFCLYLEVRSSK